MKLQTIVIFQPKETTFRIRYKTFIDLHLHKIKQVAEKNVSYNHNHDNGPRPIKRNYVHPIPLG